LNSPAAYRAGVISVRSRRLRLIAGLFMVAIVGMAVYGLAVLMPGMKQAIINAAPHPQTIINASPIGKANVNRNASAPAVSTDLHLSAKSARLLRIKVILMYGYWTVWVVFVLTLLFVVWLDLREVSRNYLNQRRELWSAAAQATQERAGPLPIAEDASNTDKPDVKSNGGLGNI
jgi:hypothetical protein